MMKSTPRLPGYARKPGRPRLEAPERLTLHFRPGEPDEIRALAHGRQLAPFIIDCVRVAGRHRPASPLERPVRTSYHVQVIGTDVPMVMQVAVDVWKDGQTVARYTGVQYPDDATGREECERLNSTSRG